MGAAAVQTAQGTTWRSRLAEASGRPASGVGLGSLSPPRVGAQRVWAFMCPNPLCDTELVVFPDYSGQLVQCPSCGFEFTAPRMVPLQIVSPDGAAQPPVYTFARGAVVARPSPQGSPHTGTTPSPLPAPSPGPRTGAATPETAQAAAALGALAGSAPVAEPKPERSETPARPTPLPAPAPRTAVDALDALARAAAQPGTHPAPARVERKGRRQPHARPDRRRHARADVAPVRPDAPIRLADGRKRADLVLTWVVAVLVSVGLGLAAWIVKVPDLALGSLLFVGLAGLRTFLVAKPERTDRPPG